MSVSSDMLCITHAYNSLGYELNSLGFGRRHNNPVINRLCFQERDVRPHVGFSKFLCTGGVSACARVQAIVRWYKHVCACACSHASNMRVGRRARTWSRITSPYPSNCVSICHSLPPSFPPPPKHMHTALTSTYTHIYTHIHIHIQI